ncbi:MAG: hypothetical protein AB2807_12465 [Candidatus Sedimenticola endophacoides]
MSRRTVLHHLQAPWSREVREQDYYFCDDPGCPVVYFDRDASAITAEALRTEVGVKALGLVYPAANNARIQLISA